MAKARNPTNLSRAFGIPHNKIAAAGVLDSTLAIDTRLFIDPLLLEHSSHAEMQAAHKTFRTHFEKVISLLKASKKIDDAAWKAAAKLLRFPEVSGTCLGYGAGSIRGSGFGVKLSKRILLLAAEIVDIGMDSPDLFTAMALFEPDIGPDRISDMTTNIILNDLALFNNRIIEKLKLPKKNYFINNKTYQFPPNPIENQNPLILVPADILRDLPVALDWDGIADAAVHNDMLRDNVNFYIGEIWEKKSKRDKKELKKQALNSKEAFQTLITAIQEAKHNPYAVESDPEGLNKWSVVGLECAESNPVILTKPGTPSATALKSIVHEIVKQFGHLIENCGLNKELYREDKAPRHESTAQRLFWSIAYVYCKANDIDISPEIDTGTGKVDFKFSQGFTKRYLVEIKLSTNTNLVVGYSNQLNIYRESQETDAAMYLVIDVGKMGKKDEKLIEAKNKLVADGKTASEIIFIDGTIKPSASLRK